MILKAAAALLNYNKLIYLMLVEVIMAEDRTKSEQVLDSLLYSLDNAANIVKDSKKRPLTEPELAKMNEVHSMLRNFRSIIVNYFATDTVQQKLTDITKDTNNTQNNITKDRAAISNFFF